MRIIWFYNIRDWKTREGTGITCRSIEMIDDVIQDEQPIATYVNNKNKYFINHQKNGLFAIYEGDDCRVVDAHSNEGRFLKIKFMANHGRMQ